MKHTQHIIVFQQNGSGEKKIRGIRQYGKDRFRLEVISIDLTLPQVIDHPGEYLPQNIEADLVLDFLKHPDLSHELGIRCSKIDIPVVASAKKHRIEGVITPPTCCGLSRHSCLGAYAERFGAPELSVRISDGIITDIEVIRGAPCGATWEAVSRIIGLGIDEAVVRIGLETQFFCVADPAGWDPIYGKSPVHFAGNIHKAAVVRAAEAYRINYTER